MKPIAAILLLAAPVFAEEIACPPAEMPVADLANVLSAPAEERVARACRGMKVPLAVVTIRSMAMHGGTGGTIESFSLRLLAAWRYDEVEGDGRNWDKGILFLVSVDDRKCRIELGEGYGTSHNAASRTILEDRVLPRFRSGDYEGGIQAGVDAIGAMASGQPIRPAKKPGSYAWPVGLSLLALFTVVSMVRRGTNGYAWSFWRGTFSVLGYVLMALATSRGARRRRGWGYGYGGYGGGGFRIGGFGGGSRGGGGFRGGGGGRGATGSW